MVLLVVVGGFGWFWVVLDGFGWFWVVPCFSDYENFPLKISSLVLYTIVPFFSSFTISFTSPFPSPSCFLNPPQSSNWLKRLHNLLRLEKVMVTDPGFSLTSIP